MFESIYADTYEFDGPNVIPPHVMILNVKLLVKTDLTNGSQTDPQPERREKCCSPALSLLLTT